MDGCYMLLSFHSSYNKIDKKIQLYFEILLVFQKSKTILVTQKNKFVFFLTFLFCRNIIQIISHVVKNNSTEGVCRMKAEVFFGKF